MTIAPQSQKMIHFHVFKILQVKHMTLETLATQGDRNCHHQGEY